MVLHCIEQESYRVVENTDEKPQHQEDDSIDEIERGMSEAKLHDDDEKKE